MTVALVGLFAHLYRKPLTPYEIAELAYRIERVELGIPGGLQDQYAATFGGFNFIEFFANTTIVNPLRIPSEILNELEYHLMLCYTGRVKRHSRIIETQTKRYVTGNRATVEALDRAKQLAIDMKNALLKSQLDVFGELLHDAWESKKKFAPQITTSRIDKLYELAREHGAVGGKILGAGGGGYLLLYCKFDKKPEIARALERAGGQIVEFGFDYNGLQTWEVK
jgi:D-glycero-alpha-D-manno-heptose-7-phosphate kinase